MAKYNPENQKELEYLILLLLGTSKEKKLSMIHIQKELFVLRNSAEKIKPLLQFIKHFKGPFSREVSDSITSPMFCDDCWEWKPGRDKISGGHVELRDKGIEEFQRLIDQIESSQNQAVIQIIAAMHMLHDMYDNLTPKELLYVIYTTPKYKDFIEKSKIYDDVVNEATKQNLKEKLEPAFAA